MPVSASSTIRPAAVAGAFYPGSAPELQAMLARCWDDAKITVGPVPKAIIAPHAGYVYSGAVAASAYARIKPAHARIKRVVLLGPCHRVAVNGLALSGADAFETPLGSVEIDKDAAALISDLPQVQVFDATHAQEHSLEVHLPFLMSVIDDFKLLPIVVGQATPDQVAQVLERLWGGPETLIVVSSDLSHYLDYDDAQAIDRRTCHAIETLDPAAIERDGACGRFPVGGLLKLAKAKGMAVETVDLRNSGDTAGPRDRVVGYGSWLFTEGSGSRSAANDGKSETGDTDFAAETKALLARHGESLIRLAAASIENGLATGQPAMPDLASAPTDLARPGACFVTLKKNGRLRGCIGSPEAHRPLIADVAANGYAAAFRDPRFPNLSQAELPEVSLSISVLSPQVPMTIKDEADLLAQLRPGIDGLVIEDGARRALFLPSVWEQLPDKSAFLQHLKRKAGLAADHWSDGFQARRFVAEEASSGDLPPDRPLWSLPAE
ncbi:MAG TPA: extradiol dioxygenase [Rhodospirillaceae bacterium]|nr:extradiol dioxygenase [Rhodospirillaceae bacterium]|tara:strand:+ start:1760 stop:3241 length:1482 start_codon:yes stop_codon:yes gene_type:complete